MSTTELIASSTIEAIAMAMFIWGYANKDKVIAWEYKHLWNPLKEAIRKLLRKNEKIVAWANEPAKHGRPDADFVAGQVKVYGDVWK
jgi:predicted membrane chloride channel (bestrophin family)